MDLKVWFTVLTNAHPMDAVKIYTSTYGKGLISSNELDLLYHTYYQGCYKGISRNFNAFFQFSRK